MASAEEYEQKIKQMDFKDLRHLWNDRVNNDFWKSGKALEYIIIRAFELEIQKAKSTGFNSVSYPFTVDYPFKYKNEDNHEVMEQYDGAIHINGMHALIECKDYTERKIDVEPLAKLRNQLSRRHGMVFGIVFSTSGFTPPAEILVNFMAPQIILLWGVDDIEYCLNHKCFIDCLMVKYRQAIEHCEHYFNYSSFMSGFEQYKLK